MCLILATTPNKEVSHMCVIDCRIELSVHNNNYLCASKDAICFVLCREVVLFSEVCNIRTIVIIWDLEECQLRFIGVCPLLLYPDTVHIQ